MKGLQFILSHSIFISFCAAALCFQTFQLLHIKPDYFIYGLIFFSTLCSYNFYWLISKYYFTKINTDLYDFILRNISNIVVFLIAAIGLFFCLYSIPVELPVILVAVFLTLLYSMPLWPIKKLAFTRKAGFLKTIILAFTWTYITIIIPARVADQVSNIAIGLLFIARFLFMLMLCIIFDSRDIHIDKIRSLRSLATEVSRNTLHWIMIVVFVLYIIAGILLRYYFDDNAQVMAFLITGIFTFYIYKMSLSKRGYVFYYFIVDGLMLFSAIATFVASF